MLNTTRESLDIRLAAGRILGIMALTLGLLLAAVGAVQPVAAATDQAAACQVELGRVKRDISVWVGGDHVAYHFSARVQQVEQLCQKGDLRKGRNLLAEIKSDLRSLRNERGER